MVLVFLSVLIRNVDRGGPRDAVLAQDLLLAVCQAVQSRML